MESAQCLHLSLGTHESDEDDYVEECDSDCKQHKRGRLKGEHSHADEEHQPRLQQVLDGAVDLKDFFAVLNNQKNGTLPSRVAAFVVVVFSNQLS